MGKLVTIDPPPGRLYCVGDVHGCSEELTLLLDYLEQKEHLSATHDMVVFLGDYIDRGQDSRAVVDLLLQFQSHFPLTRYLRGNHEDMMLGYFGLGGSMGHMYLFNGGIQFLKSYDLSSVDSVEVNLSKFPPGHLQFFTSLESGFIIGDYILVHAGVDPQKPLSEQGSRELFWIREDFIGSSHPFEKTVVFGHTIYGEIYFDLPYKIGIDTGLVYGNRLTGIELTTKRYFEIERGGTEVMESIYTN